MTIFATAVLGPDGRPFDQIRLTGVSATGYHGVLPHEREQGQEFRADVVLHLDTRPAASGDALADTVSYADVAQDVHAVLAGPPADLVETVAERIAAVVLAHAAVVAVDVRVHKPHAPVAVPFDDVEVAIRRDRAKVPVVAAAATEPHAEPVVEDAEAIPEPAGLFGAAVSPAAPLPAPLQVPPPLPVPLPVPAPTPVPAHVDAVPPAPPATPEPAPVIDRLEVDPVEPVEVVLAIGANLGDAQTTLRAAVTDLDRLPGIQVTEVSPLARTTAVGGPEDQPDYLNAVLIARTTLSPRSLLRATQAVENAYGRVREERWGPRTLDIDIVRYGSLVARADDLEVPHPRAHERAFVLVPWAEVQPDADLPGLGGGPVARLAETAPDRAGIRWMALDWLTEPAARSGAFPVTPDPRPVAAPSDVPAQPAAHVAQAVDSAQPVGDAAQAFDPVPPVAHPVQAVDPVQSVAHVAQAFDPVQPDVVPVAQADVAAQPVDPARPYVAAHPAAAQPGIVAPARDVAAAPAHNLPSATGAVPAAAPEQAPEPPPLWAPPAPTPAPGAPWQPVSAGVPEVGASSAGSPTHADGERVAPYDQDEER